MGSGATGEAAVALPRSGGTAESASRTVRRGRGRSGPGLSISPWKKWHTYARAIFGQNLI